MGEPVQCSAKPEPALLQQLVFVDLEIHPDTEQLLKIGAWRGQDKADFYRQGRFDRADACRALLTFIGRARFIVGHNIEAHDWPYLCRLDASFEPLRDRLIDTLVLNPLAFPANPYHRLVKDYKLQRESINDPVQDCKQTAILFTDQCEVFARQETLSAVFALLLLNSGAAYPAFFQQILKQSVTGKRVKAYIEGCLDEAIVCRNSRQIVVREISSNDAGRQRAMAYALAWLGTAGTNSVLPAWVRHQHRELAGILEQLRGQCCEQPDCHYCQTHHNLEAGLSQFFGYERFRHFGSDMTASDDATASGDAQQPLQRRIVAALVGGRPTLAILPTGGGKSLCYQLPAMMKARNRGVLTIILSPLQSLMNDQVQQLQQGGYQYAASLNGSLTMPERHRVLEGIRTGDIHLLYIAPEQLRNRSFIHAIESREIGQWIIDEAHCLSKWGHDFRPDYLYIARFVAAFAARQQQPIAPVHAFTATARLDVISEILDHLETHLHVRLKLISGGHQRSNLDYRVLHCPAREKRERVLSLLAEQRDRIGDGAVIIFCNRRKYCEDMADFLNNNGWPSDFFHAGRDPHSKRRVQQAFMDGELAVMAATNAFGMGVDKADVRLVIHAHMPDSLENYLQEAGRAGRDGEPAECVLLFDEADVDKQFEMRRSQQIDLRDFIALFEAIRQRVRASKQRGGDAAVGEDTIQASSGDILRMAHSSAEHDAPGFGTDDWQYDTKVRTAIAWLVEAGLLERHENCTGVIEGTFQLTAMDQIRARLQRQRINAAESERWMRVAHAIMQHDQSDSINADQLAEQTGMEPQAVFRAVKGLQHAGVMDHDMSLVAWIKAYVAGDSRKMQAHLCELESTLFRLIREAMQDDHSSAFQLNIAHACHLLREATGQADISPPLIMQLLSLWTRLDKLLRTTPMGRDMHRLNWKRDFEQSEQRIQQRQHCSDVSMEHLYDYIPRGEKGHLRIPFKLGRLEDALQNNVTTRHAHAAEQQAEDALLALQHNNLIGLESGAAIFHSAMSLHIPRGAKRPGKGAFAPLLAHYKAQIRQIHVMREWALRMADGKEQSAGELLNDYFDLNETSLLKRYFSHRSKQSLEIPASRKRLNDIVGGQALSEIQTALVTEALDQNLLVLAGPGSGKTRLIVHRVAWLVAIQRQSPESILVLAFNRATVSELRKRLMRDQMLGKQAWRLQIHTYHSLAMRLLGELPPDAEADFQAWSDALMQRACTLLEGGQVADAGGDSDDLRQRLIAGFRFILVDEYQDINQTQYRLLSALAGRTLENEAEQLSMFAVGDDDQNIYAWNGAENRYIHQFERDYHARLAYMTENYRSGAHIIAASNRLIARHPNRLKADYPISAVHTAPDGLVQCYLGTAAALQHKTLDLCLSMLRDQQIAPERIAILCRSHQDYQPLAALLRSAGLPLCLINKKDPYQWARLREVHAMLHVLDGFDTLTAGDIRTAWLAMPEQVHLHRSVAPLWDWLAAHEASEHIVRPRQEWRSELWELARTESKKTGQGIWVGTMHSVKGLEFDHVVVFGGRQANAPTYCEELRLRYVAMTRARERLFLMQDEGRWFDRLGVEAVRLPLEAREASAGRDVLYCGMDAVDMDYVGRLPRPVDTSGLHEQHTLELHGSRGELYWYKQAVGKLSRQALAQLQQKTQQGWRIDAVKVHAIVRRRREDIADEQYLARCKQDAWDVILPEIHLCKGYWP